jgi:hypothetical protein
LPDPRKAAEGVSTPGPAAFGPQVPAATAPPAEIRSVSGTSAPNPLTEPLFWLVMSIFAALPAILAHVRLRAT